MKAKAFFEKALAIPVEIGNRKLEAEIYVDLGLVFQSLGDHEVAGDYLEKGLSTSKDIGAAEIELSCYCGLSLTKLSQKNFERDFPLLFRGI